MVDNRDAKAMAASYRSKAAVMRKRAASSVESDAVRLFLNAAETYEALAQRITESVNRQPADKPD